jgi:proteasome lid subunit RPN8/RPN11
LISLNLNDETNCRRSMTNRRPSVTLEGLQNQLLQAASDCSVLVEQQQAGTIEIPTDLLFQAASTLFPAERMAVVAGRRIHGRLMLGASYDVTENGPGTHRAHVQADRSLLRDALIGFDRSGAELAAWVHSHPGGSPGATHPSHIDRAQYEDWTRHFSTRLICMIFVADGHFRFWGEAVECGLIRVAFVGDGIHNVEGDRHVYRLAR